MKEYTTDEYIKAFGAQMYKEKVENTLSEREKKIGVASIYATDMGNIFIVNLKEQEL